MHLRYMAPATLDDELDVKITWLDKPGAKICFTYEIRKSGSGDMVLKADTIQLFTTHAGLLETSEPGFYRHWKESLK